MITKIFCDSADLKTIKKFNKNPLVSGFTTNPSLMRLEGAKNYKNYSKKLLSICKKKPISLEVFVDNFDQNIDNFTHADCLGGLRNIFAPSPGGAPLAQGETLD